MGRMRAKACDRCQAKAQTLYRVQFDASGAWMFICDLCWPAIQKNNHHYTYGGTWKAKKRR